MSEFAPDWDALIDLLAKHDADKVKYSVTARSVISEYMRQLNDAGYVAANLSNGAAFRNIIAAYEAQRAAAGWVSVRRETLQHIHAVAVDSDEPMTEAEELALSDPSILAAIARNEVPMEHT